MKSHAIHPSSPSIFSNDAAHKNCLITLLLFLSFIRHGLSRTDINIGFDDVMLFNDILQQKHAALIAATTAPASGDAKPKEEPNVLNGSFIKSESSTQSSQESAAAAAEMKEEVKEGSQDGEDNKEMKSSDSDEEQTVKKVGSLLLPLVSQHL